MLCVFSPILSLLRLIEKIRKSAFQLRKDAVIFKGSVPPFCFETGSFEYFLCNRIHTLCELYRGRKEMNRNIVLTNFLRHELKLFLVLDIENKNTKSDVPNLVDYFQLTHLAQNCMIVTKVNSKI